jgi:endonuclease III
MARAAPKSSGRASQVADAIERLYGRPSKRYGRSNPLDTLVATVLSQNTNDQNSYRAWLSLRKRFPTWQKVSTAPVRALAESIKVGGLKNQKAQRIRQILRSIRDERGSYELNFLRQMSNEEAMTYLLSMKGVGSKTAACVLVFSLGRDVFPVDTHIHRICNRLGLVRTKSADETYDTMASMVPGGRAYSFHINLIRFGRETCKAGKPLCGRCPLFEECIFESKDRFAVAATADRVATTRKSRFLMTQEVSRDRSRRT